MANIFKVTSVSLCCKISCAFSGNFIFPRCIKEPFYNCKLVRKHGTDPPVKFNSLTKIFQNSVREQ